MIRLADDPWAQAFHGSSDHPIIGSSILSIASLSLHHFRNYASLHIEPGERLVVLSGRNGAGKTNILEAISLLTPGRGLRKAKLSEMDSLFPLPLREGVRGWGSSSEIETPPSQPSPSRGEGLNPWAIAAHIHGMQGQAQIGTGRTEEDGIDKRLVKIDGKIAPQTHLGKHLSMLWLTPQMEQLFLEGASAGRRFLDRLVYTFDAEHAARINAYEQVMRDRNKLLETGSTDSFWLDTLEQKMAENTAAIAAARLVAIDSLNHTMQQSKLSFPKAELAVEGFIENRFQAGESSLAAEQALRQALEAGRTKDAAAGRTLEGAHRSELRVFHVEKQMAAESCSTGEQKALLLSIVLSQARTTALKKGLVPVLLFDEVAAHLDGIRRLELFEEICQIGTQTWMTGTDANLFSDLKGKATFLHVENGNVKST